jgi:cation diffusion facilitator CzcD-associated flavoprotein CzcO
MAPLRVCVIGGGPAAMYFCHAWNQQKKKSPRLLNDLAITCFEMRSTPGGIWRAPNKNSPTTATTSSSRTTTSDPHPIYEELWTNCAAHTFEYYDYTFDEHFQGQPIPAFLPRADVNDYMIGRVTKDHPTFFQDYFVLNTQVQWVQETIHDTTTNNNNNNNNNKGFQVTVKQLVTGQISTHFFDRCIWAAGENYLPSIPKSLQSMFGNNNNNNRSNPWGSGKETKEADDNDETTITTTTTIGGGCRLLHSAQTQTIREQCPNRKVLLIGGAFSAEDLALQCVKWGATHVDVVTRQDDAEVAWTTQWPRRKVKVHSEMAIHTVNHKNGTILLKYVEPIWPFGYQTSKDYANETVVLKDIQTVIFCTGYSPNLDMLHPSLRPACGQTPRPNMGDHPSLFVTTDFDWSTWNRKRTNQKKKFEADRFTGNVAAGQKRMIRSNSNHPDMHRGIVFYNPHMMYLCEHGAEVPLFALDIYAWLLCSYLTGHVTMPTVEELKQANMEQFLDQLQYPPLRCLFDEAYFEILETKDAYWGTSKESSSDDDSDSSDEDEDENDTPSGRDYYEYEKYGLRLLCRVMQEGKYPGVSLGTYEKLNKMGNRLVEFMDTSYEMRTDLKADYPNDFEWRTFRDAEEAELLFSIHTGTKARPLKKRWMTIQSGGSSSSRTISIRNGDI